MSRKLDELDRVRTSVILSSPFDIDPKAKGMERRAVLQKKAFKYGYASFSELAREFADDETKLFERILNNMRGRKEA